MSAPSASATARIWSSLPEAARTALEHGLSPTDLQTLLIGVVRARAGRVDPARLMRRWTDDRFVRPAAADPRRSAALEARIWAMLPPAFAGVELSPVVPLGTCAAVGAADQNRIVTTVRQTEVVSDPTNALAIEAAVRRRSGEAEVHLATSHRVLRAQQFSSPDASSHFRLFALVSSGRDTGSGRTEARFLTLQLRFWLSILEPILGPGRSRITYTLLGDPTVEQRLADTVAPALAEYADLVADPGRTRGAGYYRTAMLQLATTDTDADELGDGGFTDWTAQLLSDRKERCLISCVSIERLSLLAG